MNDHVELHTGVLGVPGATHTCSQQETEMTNLATEAMLRSENAAAVDLTRDRSKPMEPFAIRNLSVLAYANGFTLWHYKAPRMADLISSNYFGNCCDMIAKGDHIHVSAPDGGALLAVEHVGVEEVSVRRMVS